MKHITGILLILLCVTLLCVPVGASEVRSADSAVTVNSDGSCHVSLRMSFYLEDTQAVTLPLPAEANQVQVDGRSGKVSVSGQRLILQLGNMSGGNHTVTIDFDVSNALTETGDDLLLTVPLLTGFGLPVTEFSFRITLPGELEKAPKISSNWGSDVTDNVKITYSGNTVSGTAENLLDSTELYLTYTGNSAMFSKYSPDGFLGGWKTVLLALILAGTAYYILALMPSLPKKVRTFNSPEGLGAGDVGTCLTGCGMDLTMTVFSWAQMGYLNIRMERGGKIRLEKRMEMGSERSQYEIRVFQKLFSGRKSVDGTGLHYAMLCRKVAKKSPLLSQIYRSRSGNPDLYRALSVGAGACSGVMLSLGVYTNLQVWTVLFALLMAAVCGVLSYFIQVGSKSLPLGNKGPVWLGLACAGAWMVAGLLCSNVLLAAIMVAYEVLTGMAAAAGGRRSEAGRQYLAEIRGLRAHLTRGSVFDMQQCQEKNPAYFFDLMPYALALGAEQRFARRFGKMQIEPCEYLLIPSGRPLTPGQWASMMRHVADSMNRRGRKSPSRFRG